MSLKRILKHYQGRVQADLESYEILDWSNQEEQHCRFEVLHRILQEEGFLDGGHPLRLLDVGCGLGDLRTYLQPFVPDLDYVGVDVTPAILEEAQRRQPDGCFVQGDVFGETPFPVASFDVVFCSGVFNLNLGNNTDFMKRALPALVCLSRGCVVANFLHARTSDKYEHCHYYEPELIRQAIPPRADSVRIVDDYLHKDFSVVVRV